MTSQQTKQRHSTRGHRNFALRCKSTIFPVTTSLDRRLDRKSPKSASTNGQRKQARHTQKDERRKKTVRACFEFNLTRQDQIQQENKRSAKTTLAAGCPHVRGTTGKGNKQTKTDRTRKQRNKETTIRQIDRWTER